MNNKSLKASHTALIDAREGYEKAVRDANNPALASVFKGVSALHGNAHADIHQILLGRGEQFDAPGSLMAAAHKTVIAVRAAVTGIDRHSLASFGSGEERIVEDYNAAIRENGGDADVADMLRKHKDQLLQTIADMKAMAASGLSAC